uniref:SCP domain-containing protein n=1 Tax=Steinernema glaseri TaxID=37863 RepID=A0A1I7ZAA5_9BILA
MGKVLAYNIYDENRSDINRICPELATIYDLYLYDRKADHKQLLSFEGERDGFKCRGKMMMVAKTKGYCGANTAMYLIESTTFNDNFYTSKEDQYKNGKDTLGYGKEGAKGIVFYVWDEKSQG